jgi:hypothetical protein
VGTRCAIVLRYLVSIGAAGVGIGAGGLGDVWQGRRVLRYPLAPHEALKATLEDPSLSPLSLLFIALSRITPPIPID